MEKEFMEKVLSQLEIQDKKSDRIFEKLEEHDKKFDMVFEKLEEHDKKFDMVFKKLEEHDKKFDMVFEILNEHTIQIKKLQKEVSGIQDYLLQLENDLKDQIPALFDGYIMNYEKNTGIDLKQSDLKAKVELNSLRISMLEGSSKRHDELLSKLSAN